MYDIGWVESCNNHALNTVANITYTDERITKPATNMLEIARAYVYILKSTLVCINCFISTYITLNIKYITGININA